MKIKKLLVLGLVSLLTLTSVSNANAYYSKKDKKETIGNVNQLKWKTVYSSTQEYDRLNDPHPGDREFIQTIDMTPIIETYGVDKTYLFSYDGYAESGMPVRINTENGWDKKYSLDIIDKEKSVIDDIDSTGYQHKNGFYENWSKDYQHFNHLVKFKLVNPVFENSMLAFYGGYDTGNYPHVKNITVKVLE